MRKRGEEQEEQKEKKGEGQKETGSRPMRAFLDSMLLKSSSSVQCAWLLACLLRAWIVGLFLFLLLIDSLWHTYWPPDLTHGSQSP